MKLSNIIIAVVAAVAAASSSGEDAKQQFFSQLHNAEALVTGHSKALKDEALAQWSDSQIKQWADIHGLPVPQPSTRDKLLAFVRKNEHLLQKDVAHYQKQAHKQAQAAAKDANNKAHGAAKDAKHKAHDAAKDAKGAAANAHAAAGSAASEVYGTAAKAAGDAQQAASKATDGVAQAAERLFEQSVDQWSDSRLRLFLASRGIETPGKPTRKVLVELTKANAYKRFQQHKKALPFDVWTSDDLKAWLQAQGKKAQGTRDDLVSAADGAYQSAAAVSTQTVDNLYKQWSGVKKATFDTWSDSDLKAYLDTYGIKTYQGTTRNELIAAARSQYRLFTHGANPKSWEVWKDSFINSGKQAIGHARQYGSIALSHARTHAENVYDTVKQRILEIQT